MEAFMDDLGGLLDGAENPFHDFDINQFAMNFTDMLIYIVIDYLRRKFRRYEFEDIPDLD